ncbi:alcohol dehydrogenase catalytic domain-containing protein [candidate division KSB1 bacterium]|nr:alcohol dehydrogenase catalytic domain-containing protein [candidate division KSB1 bacterium]
MKAIQFCEKLELVEQPIPEPGAEEALIRVSMTGICNTDLEILRGYMNFRGTPGHEFVGRVVRVNAATAGWINQRVVGEINLGCGNCEACQRGLARHCATRQVLGIYQKDGAMAEYLTLPIANLHRVPESVPDEIAVFTEPLAACLEIFEQIPLPPNQPLAIVGDGKLGLLLALTCQWHGLEVFLLGKNETKLALARTLGITHAQLAETCQSKFPIVIEASGAPGGLQTALQRIEPRGTLVLKSTYQGQITLDMAPWVVHEITIVGSRCGPFAPALRLLTQHAREIQPLISAIYPMEAYVAAFDRAVQPTSLKIILQITPAVR